MGAVVGGRCYPLVQDAQDAYYGAISVFSFSSGNKVVEVSYVRSSTAGSGWARQTATFSKDGGAAISVVSTDQSLLDLPSCDPGQSFLDGTIVGWGIGSVLVAVAALKLMQRGWS